MSFNLTNSTEKVITLVIVSSDQQSSKSFRVNHSTKLNEVFDFYSLASMIPSKQLCYWYNNGVILSPDSEVRSILPRLSATRVAINSSLVPQDI